MAVFRSLLQNIALLTDIDRGGGYDLLTDGINRRIGYLGEELFEVVKQRLMLLESTANGLSAPMADTASAPFNAIGRIMVLYCS